MHNALFQLSVISTPALNQTHKGATCKAACMLLEMMMVMHEDPDEKVYAVKQG